MMQPKHAMQAHDSASKQDQVQVWEEQRPVSKYALGLQQEPSNGRTIPSNPSAWQCAETGVKENLWLNLSTGVIGSGRQVCYIDRLRYPSPLATLRVVYTLCLLIIGSMQLQTHCPHSCHHLVLAVCFHCTLSPQQVRYAG